MAIEMYVVDTLSLAERIAVEAKRMRALSTAMPKGCVIGGQLEERIESSNGYSSSFEMRDTLKKMGISYDANSSTHYNYKILVPEGQYDAVKDLVQKSGYSILNNLPEHEMPTLPAK
ncbi:MAG: hypothetical protein NTY99_00920 [DPANN group archaeon]|nr:hypothetical protein [DPANN group archaeon]